MPQLSTIRNKWHLAPCSSGSPPGRIGHTFCADAEGNNAYVYGGVNEAEQRVSSNYVDDFWEYNILSKQWRMVPLTGETQCSRAFHSSVWFGDLMYVFGGCNGRGRFNRLFSINSEGDCQLVDIEGTPPTTRYCHSAVLFDGRMFIYGGKCGGRNSNRRLDDLFCCDLRKPSWRVCLQTGDVPPPRSAHSAVTYERSMVIFGGRNSDGECCPDCYLYYFDTQVWRKVECPAPHLFGRARNCAVVHFGNVVVFGGWNGKKKLNDLFTFNIEANIVEATTEDDPACPSRRECLLAVLCRNTMVVFGGRFRGSFMNDTAELYLGPKKVLDSARLWVQAVKRPDMLQALHLPRQVVDMIERCGQVVVR